MMPLIIVLIACGLILIYGSLFWSQKKANDDNPIYHVEKDGKIYVNVFYTSKTGGNYKEFVFERTEDGYVLTEDEKRKIISTMKFICIFSAVISVGASILVYTGSGTFLAPALLLPFFVIIAVFAVYEYSHYARCIRYLKENRP